MENGLLKSVMVIFMGLIVGCASQSKIESTSISSTTPSQKTITEERIKSLLDKGDFYFQKQQYMYPEGQNAYEYYKKVLALDSSNEYASIKIRDILEALLNNFDQNEKKYKMLLKAENEGIDIKREMVSLLISIVDILKSGKKIYEESNRDVQTDEMIQIFQDNINKYSRLRSFYEK